MKTILLFTAGLFIGYNIEDPLTLTLSILAFIVTYVLVTSLLERR